MTYYKTLFIAIVLFIPSICMANCCCKKIIDYMVVRESIRGNFTETIRNLIAEGWQPFGGVSNSMNNAIIQAMVKYESD